MRKNNFPIHFLADEFLYAKLKEMASMQNRSLSSFIRYYLRISFFDFDERMRQIRYFNAMKKTTGISNDENTKKLH